MFLSIMKWTWAWFLQGSLIGMAGYQLNILSSAESFSVDFMQVSRDINYIAPYEILVCVICNLFTIVFLGQTTLFLMQLPVTFFNLYRYYKQRHILDPTEVYKPGVLNSWMKASIMRIILYCILFASFFVAVVYDIFFGHFLGDQSNFFLTWVGLGSDSIHPVKKFLGHTAEVAASHLQRAMNNHNIP
jgi:hypothetical protein